MDPSLGSLRSLVLDLRSWSTSGSSFNTRFRRAFNHAKDRLVGDCPEAILPDNEHVVLYAPVSSADTAVAARLQATSDRWVLRFVDTAGTAMGASALTSWRPTTDRTWDGVMHLEVRYDATNDRWARHQSREWWSVNNVLGVATEYYVSLDRRWRNTTDTDLSFRIHQPEFFTRDNVIEVLAPGEIYDSTSQQMWPIDAAGRARQGMRDWLRETTNRPERMWRNRRFQLPSPTLTPVHLAGGQASWVGPVQEGTFTIVYTYTWGRRDVQWQEAGDSGIPDPLWESAPSPVSTSFAHADNPGMAILMTAANIDAMRNFDVAGTTRETHSGMRIRFYVARTATRTAGAGQSAYNRVEADGRYYLLVEIDPTDTADAQNPPTYKWTGDVIPDYTRPLNFSTGYFAWSCWPPQDARYEVDFRVLRMPLDVVDDQDVLPIEKDALAAFVELLLYFLCLFDGVDQVDAKAHLDRYRESLLPLVRKRYANQGRVVEPRSLGGSRLGRSLGAYSEES